jgi:hypothetical protein
MDTTIKGTLLLKYLPIQMTDYNAFTSKKKRFLLYEEDRDPGRDWLVLRLSWEGWSVQAKLAASISPTALSTRSYQGVERSSQFLSS